MVAATASENGLALVATERRAMTMVRPLARPEDVIEAHEELTQLVVRALKEGTDYGAVPGTDRKTLLKPGAERLALAYGAHPVYEVVEHEIDHDREVRYHLSKWTAVKPRPGKAVEDEEIAKGFGRRRNFGGDWVYQRKIDEDGKSLGLYRYVIRCRLMRQDGLVLGEGMGSCSTMETKYIRTPRDVENTVLKMAQKRALIAATLNAFGLSDRFTQDVEDGHEDSPHRSSDAVDADFVPVDTRDDEEAKAENLRIEAAVLAIAKRIRDAATKRDVGLAVKNAAPLGTVWLRRLDSYGRAVVLARAGHGFAELKPAQHEDVEVIRGILERNGEPVWPKEPDPPPGGPTSLPSGEATGEGSPSVGEKPAAVEPVDVKPAPETEKPSAAEVTRRLRGALDVAGKMAPNNGLRIFVDTQAPALGGDTEAVEILRAWCEARIVAAEEDVHPSTLKLKAKDTKRVQAAIGHRRAFGLPPFPDVTEGLDEDDGRGQPGHPDFVADAIAAGMPDKHIYGDY